MDILVKLEKSLQMDWWPSTLFRPFCFVFVFPSSCKIGVWLNTCKLCCDYQPLKSSLKINLYIVKFPRLFVFIFYKLSKKHCVLAVPAVQQSMSLLLLCITPAGGADSAEDFPAEEGCFYQVRSHFVLFSSAHSDWREVVLKICRV